MELLEEICRREIVETEFILKSKLKDGLYIEIICLVQHDDNGVNFITVRENGSPDLLYQEEWGMISRVNEEGFDIDKIIEISKTLL